MMNRRDFLVRSIGTSAGALIAPSLIWPFRKIFIPTALNTFWINSKNLLIPEPHQADALLAEEINRLYPEWNNIVYGSYAPLPRLVRQQMRTFLEADPVIEIHTANAEFLDDFTRSVLSFDEPKPGCKLPFGFNA